MIARARRVAPFAVLVCSAFAAACGAEAGRGDTAARRFSAPEDARPIVLFLGTSLTAGLGVAPEEAYPALIERKVDSAGYQYRVVNAGVSGETAAGGLRRAEWLLRQPIGVLVLELGANDALRGQDLRETRRDLQEIIMRTRGAHPNAAIVIAGMQAPPNMGRAYTMEFRRMFSSLAAENAATLIPFLLEDVGGVAELNQSDGIHPTAEGHAIMAEHVWRVLEPVLRAHAPASSP